MPKVGKPKSKRTPVRLRHKIEKAGAAKQRKQKKLAKTNPEWRSRLKKDPGIPNLFPYKDRILHEIEEKRHLKEEEYMRKREANKEATRSITIKDDALEDEGDTGEEDLNGDDQMDDDAPKDSSDPMSALLASAKARAAEYENDPDEDDMDEDRSDGGGVDIDSSIDFTTSGPQTQESSRRAFDKIFKNVLSTADVILYVLDARDPNGTRSREIERQVLAADAGSKRLILVLNKIDLVPPPVLKSWLIYLRRSFPTLPLRASNPAPNARTFDHKSLTVKGTSETLLRALKTYAQSKNLKRSTTVGIIGYPNVGKSSVINALTCRLGGSSARAAHSSSTACPVGAEAGVTTSLREVKLDNKLKLLDSPGIVFPSTSSSFKTDSTTAKPSPEQHTPKIQTQANLILLNALPPKQITDPIPAISLLLSRLSSTPALLASLLKTYNLPPLLGGGGTSPGDTTTDFLVQVARKRGRLGKGGVPNLYSAAMTVVTDWRDGRIEGWVEAPVDVDEGRAGEKVVVESWGKEFWLEGLWGEQKGEAEMEDGDEVMKE